jgi:Outer membrane protein beta-barrel domain
MKRLLAIALFFTISFSSFAQTTATPAQTLRLARATYEQGRLHEIPTQLNAEVISGMTSRQDKVEAYKILCLSYIYLEEPEQADEAMLNILITDHYFEINEVVDPAEFVALYYTFRRNPIFRIGAKLGGNFSRPNVSQNISAVELAEGSRFKSSFGLQFGAAAEVPLFNKLTLHGELLYLQHRYQIKEKVYRGIDLQTGQSLSNEFRGIESQSWVSLPISVEYAYLNSESRFHKKFQPYVAAGFVFQYLTGAKITADRQREGEASIPESSIDVEREKFGLGVLLSTGIKIKMASGLFVADIRYVHGLTNVSSSATAYSNQKLVWEYGYADPVFKMSSLGANISYVQDIFKPKKLKRKK